MVPTIDGYKRAYGSVLCEAMSSNKYKSGYTPVNDVRLTYCFMGVKWLELFTLHSEHKQDVYLVQLTQVRFLPRPLIYYSNSKSTPWLP